MSRNQDFLQFLDKKSSPYFSSNRWESIAIFYFNSIPPCLQQWLPILAETSKSECIIVIPQVLDENQSQFLILTRFLYVFSEVVRVLEKALAQVYCIWGGLLWKGQHKYWWINKYFFLKIQSHLTRWTHLINVDEKTISLHQIFIK